MDKGISRLRLSERNMIKDLMKPDPGYEVREPERDMYLIIHEQDRNG